MTFIEISTYAAGIISILSLGQKMVAMIGHVQKVLLAVESIQGQIQVLQGDIDPIKVQVLDHSVSLHHLDKGLQRLERMYLEGHRVKREEEVYEGVV